MKIEITSRSNPRLQALLKNREKLVFFEGEKLVGDILARPLTVSTLVYSSEMEKRLPEISATVVEQWRVSRPVLEKISELKTPPEIIAVLAMPAWEINLQKQKIVFAFDSLQDPANLGAVFRCAAAFNVSALVMAGACVRANHPKVVRAAQTALLDVPFQVFPSLEELLAEAQARKVHIYLTGSHASGRPLAVANMEFPCLVLFGNEGQGLARSLLARFPLIRLEQAARIDSLNVAVSACILMHEVKRVHGW
ncbi:MAG: RNA methyltransferase [Candidatus Aminicenantes bacterium]|nr:RNA methyltransferase [Candidatus Aminicenantes bacterium]